MRSTTKTRFGGDSAVVMGGSIAGLLAARVLADHFDRVTIIERDELPRGPQNRKGVPQGRHSHALLTGGAEVLEKLFPGFGEEMKKAGSVVTDPGSDWAWFHHGAWQVRPNTNMQVFMQSRSFLEWHVRRRVREYANVQFMEECSVTEFLHNDTLGRIDGVRFKRHNGQPEEEGQVEAELVVDATGRGTRTPRWLEKLGYGRPEEAEVEIKSGFASRIVKPPENVKRDWDVLYTFSDIGKNTRVGAITPIEGNRWMVTLSGYCGDYPSMDEDAFCEFARSLVCSEFYDVLKRCTPLTPIVAHRLPSNLRRFYENMSQFPDGLVVVGDAICSFNPIFGQGMTTAALGAETLQDCLKDQPSGSIEGLSDRFQEKTARYNDVAWLLATSEDMEVNDERSLKTKILSLYVDKIRELSTIDEYIAVCFLQVAHFKKRFSTLFSPKIILKALGLT